MVFIPGLVDSGFLLLLDVIALICGVVSVPSEDVDCVVGAVVIVITDVAGEDMLLVGAEVSIETNVNDRGEHSTNSNTVDMYCY